MYVFIMVSGKFVNKYTTHSCWNMTNEHVVKGTMYAVDSLENRYSTCFASHVTWRKCTIMLCRQIYGSYEIINSPQKICPTYSNQRSNWQIPLPNQDFACNRTTLKLIKVFLWKLGVVRINLSHGMVRHCGYKCMIMGETHSGQSGYPGNGLRKCQTSSITTHHHAGMASPVAMTILPKPVIVFV